MQIQIIDQPAKIYKAFYKYDPFKSIRFKFFTNYMLVNNRRLKIFDFQEVVLFHQDHSKFIITRLNEFTNEMEIHIADFKEIEEYIQSLDFSDQTFFILRSKMKECMEIQKLSKLISVNIKDEFFIIVMANQQLIYGLDQLLGFSNEKISPLSVIIFVPILVSHKPYISTYVDDKIFLFQKQVDYKGNINSLIINYKVINCKKPETPQYNYKITFPSPLILQSTETMISQIEKVKIYDENHMQLTIYTGLNNQSYKQKVIQEFGETQIIKKQKLNFKQSDDIYIQCASNKNYQIQNKEHESNRLIFCQIQF